MLKIETLAIGDELLDGRITDRNASLLARELRVRDAAVQRMTVIPDSVEGIAAELAAIGQRADVVVCSGGLGPTRDDCTRDAAARWLGVETVYAPEHFARIEALFRSVGLEVTPNNKRQAYFPTGAEVLENGVGTAPGFAAVHPETGLKAFFLPGVPSEYRWFLNHHVLDAITGGDSARRLVRATRVYFGLGESKLEHTLEGIEVPEGVTLGYRAHFPEIHVTVSAWAREGDGMQAAAEGVLRAIEARLGRFLVAEGEETLVERVAGLLTAQQARVTTAESCTGGMIAAALTSVAGSSAYIDEAVVTYSNAAKVARVGVEEATLAAYGAVSRGVVVEMARGARARAGATYGVAVSGIAGPGGGSAAKPVGTVEIAVAEEGGVWYRPLRLKPRWGRDRIRQATVHHALALLLKRLEDRVGDDPEAEWVPSEAGG